MKTNHYPNKITFHSVTIVPMMSFTLKSTSKLRSFLHFRYYSVYEKLKATRAKVAPVNLIYGSHFSATEATNKVSQNMGNFVEFTRTFTRITHKPVPV